VFVSFEGFQLLTYEYSEMENGIDTLKKGMIASIGISTLIYVMVAAVTTSLVSPEQIIQHKETVLAFAASQIFNNPVVRKVSVFLVSAAALFSTASAINATLFGTARFSNRMSSDGELPDLFSFRNREGVPTRSLLFIGVLTGLFTFIGSLEEITTFASISFIGIFSVVNLLAFRESEETEKKVLTGAGLLGTVVSFLLLVWHLYVDKLHVLVFVAGLFTALLLLEFLYFEREPIEEELEKAEKELEEEIESAEEEVEKAEEDIEEKLEE
ncbi:MAG: APC family permease, partial [Candidatus Nanohalobium sp.]